MAPLLRDPPDTGVTPLVPRLCRGWGDIAMSPVRYVDGCPRCDSTTINPAVCNDRNDRCTVRSDTPQSSANPGTDGRHTPSRFIYVDSINPTNFAVDGNRAARTASVNRKRGGTGGTTGR